MSSHLPITSPPPTSSNFELELLKEEYFFLQKTIEDYNKQIWAIKSLGLTGTGVVIGLMLQQQSVLISLIEKYHLFVLLIVCAIPILFWILESQWKHFQRGFYPRAAEIESLLTHQFHYKSPGIYHKWSSSFKRPTGHLHVNYWTDGLFARSVCVTYILEISFLSLLFFLIQSAR